MSFNNYKINKSKIYNNNIEFYEDKVNSYNFINNLNIKIPNIYFILNNIDELYNIKLPNYCVIKYNNLASSKGIIIKELNKYKNCFNNIFNNFNDAINYLKNNNKQSKYCQESIKNIKQKIIIEELLYPSNNNILYDIKCYTINSKITHIAIINPNNRKETYSVDKNFNRLNYDKRDINYLNKIFEKPKYFDDIINYCEIILKKLNFDILRIDFYSTTIGAVFGEFTFNPGVSFLPEIDKFFYDILIN